MSNTNEELAICYQRGDRAALATLWMQVRRLAYQMVGRYIRLAHQNGALDTDDLLQAAFLGVERAAVTFRADAGAFTTVMGLHVRRECRAALGLRGRVRRECYEAVPTSTPLGDDGGTTLLDALSDDALPDEGEELLRDDVRQEVRAAIDRLPGAQAEVICGYHLQGERLGMLAERQGVSLARAGQLTSKAMRALWRDRVRGFCSHDYARG